MRWSKGSGRSVWWAPVVAALLLAVGASCGEDEGNNATSSVAAGTTSSGLPGTWVTVPGFDEVT